MCVGGTLKKSISPSLLGAQRRCALQRYTHYRREEMDESKLKQGASSVSFPPSMVPVAMPPSPISRLAISFCSDGSRWEGLMHMHASRYVQTCLLGGSSRIISVKKGRYGKVRGRAASCFEVTVDRLADSRHCGHAKQHVFFIILASSSRRCCYSAFLSMVV